MAPKHTSSLLILLAISMNQVAEGMGKILAFALIALIPYMEPRLKKWFKNQTDYFGKNLKIRSQINEDLNEIRLSMDADRVCLFEFSNTDKSVSNFPFEYLNLTYEKCSNQMVEIRDNYQKKHINPYVDFLQMFSEHDVLYRIIQTESPDTPESVSLRMQERDIKTCIVFKLGKELRTGFLALHYITDEYTENWDAVNGMHKDMRFLKMKAMNILTLMKQLQ